MKSEAYLRWLIIWRRHLDKIPPRNCPHNLDHKFTTTSPSSNFTPNREGYNAQPEDRRDHGFLFEQVDNRQDDKENDNDGK